MSGKVGQDIQHPLAGLFGFPAGEIVAVADIEAGIADGIARRQALGFARILGGTPSAPMAAPGMGASEVLDVVPPRELPRAIRLLLLSGGGSEYHKSCLR